MLATCIIVTLSLISLMNTYIQKDKEGFYFETTEELQNVGITYPDFLNGRPIKLSEDQVRYHNWNLDADIETVLNVCEYKDGGEVLWYVSQVPMTLDYAKELKKNALAEYDKSDAINDLIIIGSIHGEIHGWLTPEQRSNYKNSVESAKLIGVEELTLYVGDYFFNLTTSDAERYLAMIQLYADRCSVVTKMHERNIMSLESVDAVEGYDFTSGYPPKLRFELDEV